MNLGRCCFTYHTLLHPCLTSKFIKCYWAADEYHCFSAGYRALDFEPWLKKQTKMQFVHVLENNIAVYLLFNRPFRDFNHHTVTSNNHHFSSKTCNAVLNSPSLSVLVMMSFSLSVLMLPHRRHVCCIIRVHASHSTLVAVGSRHQKYNVRTIYSVFFIRSEHRKSFFCG